jgi:hypothetical protein
MSGKDVQIDQITVLRAEIYEKARELRNAGDLLGGRAVVSALFMTEHSAELAIKAIRKAIESSRKAAS